MSGLIIEGLCISIGERDVLRAVDLRVEPGTCVGLVGESGSGKSLTALASLGLLPRTARVKAGRILLGDDEILTPGQDRTAGVRGSGIAMIFQSPRAALNPVLPVGHQVERVLRRNGHRHHLRRSCVELLRSVGLLEPEQVAGLYPHELSGGMCQRIMIAMGIASEPQILIADEPTTALDVTVQADILDLLDDLRNRINMGMLLISHDLSVVAERCQMTSVMLKGAIVESNTCRALIDSPGHPFTAGLVRDLTQSPAADEWPVQASAADSGQASSQEAAG